MRALAVDRRGITAVVFALCGTAMLGFVGLATEAGTWYLVRTRVQDAADAAALAAALANSSGANYTDAATYVAAQNGFSSGVSVHSPPANCYVSGSTCSTSDSAQFEVVINTSVTSTLSTLFTAATSLSVLSHGVATLQTIGQECMLSLTGDLSVTTTQSAQRCIYGSNATDSSAVTISSVTATLASVTAAGDCSGCTGAGVTWKTRPYAIYQPSSSNSFTGFAAPTAGCAAKFSGTSLTPGVYCQSSIPAANLVSTTTPPTFNMNGASTWTLAPGVYYFSGVSLAINASTGGIVRCMNGATTCSPGNGVAIVLTGSPVGNLYICTWSAGSCTGASKVTLQNIGARTSTTDTALKGMLFYRDSAGSAGTLANPAANIWGNTNTQLNGAMYFPGAFVSYGNPASGANCSIVVAATLSLKNATTAADLTNCASYGTTPPQARAVRVVE